MAKSNNSPRRSSEPRITEALKPVGPRIPLDKLLADHAVGGSGSQDLTPWRQSRFDPLP
jgi:hypothetical protein